MHGGAPAYFTLALKMFQLPHADALTVLCQTAVNDRDLLYIIVIAAKRMRNDQIKLTRLRSSLLGRARFVYFSAIGGHFSNLL